MPASEQGEAIVNVPRKKNCSAKNVVTRFYCIDQNLSHRSPSSFGSMLFIITGK